MGMTLCKLVRLGVCTCEHGMHVTAQSGACWKQVEDGLRLQQSPGVSTRWQPLNISKSCRGRCLSVPTEHAKVHGRRRPGDQS